MAASLSDILTVQQNGVVALNNIQTTRAGTIPTTTSGTLTAATLIQTGFVRVTGISVVVAGAAGGLYDTTAVSLLGSTNQTYVVAATLGFTEVNMVFMNGLVYSPGAGQTAVIYYTRV